MKRLSVVVAGTRQIKDIQIEPGTTVRDVMQQLRLRDYLLTKGPNEPFLAKPAKSSRWPNRNQIRIGFDPLKWLGTLQGSGSPRRRNPSDRRRPRRVPRRLPCAEDRRDFDLPGRFKDSLTRRRIVLGKPPLRRGKIDRAHQEHPTSRARASYGAPLDASRAARRIAA